MRTEQSLSILPTDMQTTLFQDAIDGTAHPVTEFAAEVDKKTVVREILCLTCCSWTATFLIWKRTLCLVGSSDQSPGVSKGWMSNDRSLETL